MLNTTVTKHTQEEKIVNLPEKKKHPITEESNKFFNQLDFTQKEIDLKDKEIEAAKYVKKQKNMV